MSAPSMLITLAVGGRRLEVEKAAAGRVQEEKKEPMYCWAFEGKGGSGLNRSSVRRR